MDPFTRPPSQVQQAHLGRCHEPRSSLCPPDEQSQQHWTVITAFHQEQQCATKCWLLASAPVRQGNKNWPQAFSWARSRVKSIEVEWMIAANKKRSKDATPRSTPRSTKSCQIAPAPTQQDKQDLFHLIPGLYLTTTSQARPTRPSKCWLLTSAPVHQEKQELTPGLYLTTIGQGSSWSSGWWSRRWFKQQYFTCGRAKVKVDPTFFCQLEHCWLKIHFP